MAIEKWLITPGQTKVIDLELVRSLKVSLIGGKVDVIAHDEPGARIVVDEVTGKDLEIKIDGDRLEIDHPQLRWDNWIDVFKGFRGNARATVSILAPRSVALKFGMVSADGLISGFTGSAKLSTVSGDLVLDSHVGDVDLNSVSGELSVSHHDGGVNVHSVSGDVVVSGDVTKLSVDTVSGDMIVDASGVPDRIDTNTVSGDLTVRFDGTSGGARYRVNTISGLIVLDDLTIKGNLGQGFERTVGNLDGQWLDLGANSVSGKVSVLRRTAPTDSAREASADSGAGAGA
ncbi:DUF4097 family beta strand repeat-containing protein [Agromyces seonyuensis]|uniref:DUF4097 family beta strand repeat protein n=1 Tax=Agromyces seonyuensis TaxID=2662446 RepID=A0A6I4NXL4_9MICO|nr:DUF4097 family beta strand repeat-containing protein [Agromyces seonyuensis]MWB97255.1 DUF4097 family beta strand repeat protein [Agromyces seonyuensis]